LLKALKGAILTRNHRNLANIGTVTQRGNYINVRIGLLAVTAIAIVLSITPLEEKVDETS